MRYDFWLNRLFWITRISLSSMFFDSVDLSIRNRDEVIPAEKVQRDALQLYLFISGKVQEWCLQIFQHFFEIELLWHKKERLLIK